MPARPGDADVTRQDHAGAPRNFVRLKTRRLPCVSVLRCHGPACPVGIVFSERAVAGLRPPGRSPRPRRRALSVAPSDSAATLRVARGASPAAASARGARARGRLCLDRDPLPARGRRHSYRAVRCEPLRAPRPALPGTRTRQQPRPRTWTVPSGCSGGVSSCLAARAQRTVPHPRALSGARSRDRWLRRFVLTDLPWLSRLPPGPACVGTKAPRAVLVRAGGAPPAARTPVGGQAGEQPGGAEQEGFRDGGAGGGSRARNQTRRARRG